MAEKKEIQFENIKKVGLLAGDDEIGALLAKVKKAQKDVSEIVRGLNEKVKELISVKAEAEFEDAAVEAEAKPAAEEPVAETPAEEKPQEKPARGKKKAEQPAPQEPAEQPKEEAPAPQENPAEPAEAEVKAKEEVPAEEAKAPSEKEEKPAAKKAKAAKQEPAAKAGKTEKAENPALPSFIVKKADPNAPEEKAKKVIKKEFIPSSDKREKKPYPPRSGAPAGAKKSGEKQVRTFVGTEPSRFAPPATPQKDGKGFGAKKKTEKNYEEKKAVNKRALIKTQISVSDFDEDKTGYRKLRTKKQKSEQSAQTVKIEKAVITTEIIPIKTLSEKIGVSAVEITKKLFKEGIIKTINDTIDYDTAAYIAADIGVELELKLEKTAEDVLSALAEDAADDESKLVRRPPVVTVMGHVDHGKTSLLDKIRSTNVTAGEAGGITQHIGAYTVSVKGNQITFIDTPGHAAFTAMRARGAQVTDIAIIVIAADDGIMPQTIEAINHAKAANVSIIVAANKIDKPTANIDRIRQQLTEHDILVEDWGGDVILAPVSAKTGEGIPELLETIQLVAEMRDLKANPDRMAKGTIIEAQLDKGKGPVATVLIQNGTLKTGDNIVAGTVVGRVRAMIDDKGRTVKSAGPSMAVSILGLEEVPNAGDSIYAVEQEKLTKLVAQERKNKEREDMIRQTQRVSLDDLFSKIAEGKQLSLNIIIKADVQGSVEAVKQSLVKLSNDEVKVNVIHAAVGAISETDVMLADSSNSVIIGFNVRPDSNAKTIAERQHIDVKLYKIIYEAIEDVQKAMKGLLAPKFNDVYMGKAEVRNTFNITGVGTVAGCYVTDGKIVRSGGKLRIYRDDILICEGNVLQLKRFKDDVKEVQQGFECGMSIENFNDIKIGDFIECYITEEVKD
ncbi:MAG: translation initiation factor IF-2 [Clostridia bacterium]|nr:translation initiation factor IF-2 [Clostridia bacterium]